MRCCKSVSGNLVLWGFGFREYSSQEKDLKSNSKMKELGTIFARLVHGGRTFEAEEEQI